MSASIFPIKCCFDPLQLCQWLLSLTRSWSSLCLIGSGYKESSKFSLVFDQPVDVVESEAFQGSLQLNVNNVGFGMELTLSCRSTKVSSYIFLFGAERQLFIFGVTKHLVWSPFLLSIWRHNCMDTFTKYGCEFFLNVTTRKFSKIYC